MIKESHNAGVDYMFLICAFLFVIAAVKWGDWKNLRLYYPTILFFIIGDLLYNFTLYNYPMWTFKELVANESILFNHTFISLLHMFVIYPATVLIFLGRLPQKLGNQVLWIGLWVGIYIAKELLSNSLGLITHSNGWNNWWSLVFDVIMFLLVLLHYKRTLLALCLSGIWIVLLLYLHDVPLNTFK